MGRLMQRIEREPAPCIADGTLRLSAIPQIPRQAFERTAQFTSQALSLEKLPVLEGWTITQIESTEEIAGIEAHRFIQQGNTRLAHIRDCMAMRLASRKRPMKRIHI